MKIKKYKTMYFCFVKNAYKSVYFDIRWKLFEFEEQQGAIIL